MRFWDRLVGRRPIVTRLVIAVALTMTAVLVASSAFVLWRVGYALDRQLDQDLDAYGEVVQRAVGSGAPPPRDTAGLTYQVYDASGTVVAGDATRRLVDVATVRRIFAGAGDERLDVGSLLPAVPHPYRVVVRPVSAPSGRLVLATAISRAKHDEALRELLLQLTLASLATLAAASFVGYRTARGALDPVERYRRAAERAGAEEETRLPVDTTRDDELTRLVQTFNALLVRIRAASDRERQFLADASHELRSPLALMRAELDWALLKRESRAELEGSLESLSVQVERLVALSDALLELEELRSTAAAVDEEVDLGLLLSELSDHWAERVRAAGRQLVTTSEDGLRVAGRQRWLELALGNLVANGLRHGRGRIRVTARRDPDGPAILLEVCDEGVGFPPEFLDRAFDRFARADQSRSTPGSGLGLALVRAVAQAHGGEASISGACVAVRLPAAPSRSRLSGSGAPA